MRFYYALFAAAPLYCNATEIDAHIEGYGVVVPEWEVEITPGGPTTVLTGTKSTPDAEYHCGGRWPKCRTTIINQGISYLRRIKGKPRNGPGPGNCGRVSCSFNSAIWWCNDAAADTEKRDSDKHLFGRTNFNGAKYTCRSRWPECHPAPIVRGVEYIRYVQGKPKNGPGPGNCGRVSCSNNAAIWWCNDNASSKTLNGFGSIAGGAEYINNKCTRWGWQNGGYRSFVSGQVFHSTKWNVIVRKDKC
ncbi:hypothetical protein FOYG_00683 [Fusarium oxysporum NRRL 32931]|uniref:Uncharacterized protein n=1 Tax=Fusarium oxysporum NRRL 32931 TaxID=660029 RepID=W9J815_FUSOX|nr:hypothetical protein FOYG_00683 [Fusarium oxysporum NRRL 32931]